MNSLFVCVCVARKIHAVEKERKKEMSQTDHTHTRERERERERMKKKERIVARDGHRIKNRPKKKGNRTPIIYLFSLAQSKMLTQKERKKDAEIKLPSL